MTQAIRDYEIFATRLFKTYKSGMSDLFEFPLAQGIHKVMHSTKQFKSHVPGYYQRSSTCRKSLLLLYLGKARLVRTNHLSAK